MVTSEQIREYKRNYYYRDKQRQFENTKNIQKRNKIFIYDLKSKLKCIKCGEDHPACLDFHHRNPEEKKKGISEAVLHGWSITRIKEEVSKCDIICSNCHRKLHYVIGQI